MPQVRLIYFFFDSRVNLYQTSSLTEPGPRIARLGYQPFTSSVVDRVALETRESQLQDDVDHLKLTIRQKRTEFATTRCKSSRPSPSRYVGYSYDVLQQHNFLSISHHIDI